MEQKEPKPKKKLLHLRMTLDLEVDLQGVDIEEVKSRLYRMAKTAYDNGTFTGSSPATVEHYACSVREVQS